MEKAMPKFLEDKLKAEYGAKSDIPYKVMNSMGEMRGNKETPKGARMEAKHIEHVHEHLNTDHLHGETHKGVDKHGEKHMGHVAGTLPAHKHEKVTHHYEK
jgi:hypothetical protein